MLLAWVLAPGPSWLGAAPTTLYVSLTGSHEPPFDSWSKAATNLIEAVALARDTDTVLLTNGVYLLSNEVVVTAAVHVASLNGPGVTVVDGMTSNRCFQLKHVSAVVEGLTIQRGRSDSGGGVRFGEGGTLRGCIVESNRATHLGGGGVYLRWEGVVEDCVIRHNLADQADGGGVYAMSGGVVRRSVIAGNSARVGGGIVAMFHSRLINCLVISNQALQAGGVMCSQGAQVVHCTIARNGARTGGGLHGFYGGLVRNSIIRENSADLGADYYLLQSFDSPVRLDFCNLSPLAPGLGNLDLPPLWIDPDAGNYRLQAGSPCVDAGLNDDAPATDLDGLPRTRDGDGDGESAVDLGAYEFNP